jgi:hypothetical protein
MEFKLKSIQEAINYIVERENIKTKDDLDIWCGGSKRKKLYEDVKRLVPEKWTSIAKPECSVRACYEHILPGYKLYKDTNTNTDTTNIIIDNMINNNTINNI